VTRSAWQTPSAQARPGPVHRPGRAAEAVPATLAVAVVATQAAYPLVDGAARDRLAIAVVALFAAASLAHAALRRGVAFAGWLLAIAGGVGMGAELIGVATGWPFGEYRYTGALGPHVAGVAVVVPLAWTMMAYPALVVARHVTRRPIAGVALAAWALTAWDLFLDPQMVADGAWRWAADGAYAGVPLSNYAGWLAVSLVIAAALWPLAERAEARRGLAAPDRLSRRGDAVPVALYAWTWLGSVVAHAALLDLAASAVAGGLGMGAVVVAWLATGAARAPDASEVHS